jgi:hypothetical protein
MKKYAYVLGGDNYDIHEWNGSLIKPKIFSIPRAEGIKFGFIEDEHRYTVITIEFKPVVFSSTHPKPWLLEKDGPPY